MIKRTLLLLSLTTVAIVGPMATARACSCMVPDPAAFLADSDFVFAGSLIDDPGRGMEQIGDIAYTFEVDAVYKGDIRDQTIDIWSASNGAACGFEIAPGQPVAIAASVFDGRLTGGLCATFDVAQLEAAATEAGIEPVIPQARTGDADGGSSDQASTPVMGTAVAVLVATAGVAVGVAAAVALTQRSRGGENG